MFSTTTPGGFRPFGKNRQHRPISLNTASRIVVLMKVLCLGLSRTGISSLWQALLNLGISDVYHCTSVMSENPPDADLCVKALEAKLKRHGPEFNKEDLDALTGHCMAVSDHPCLTFTGELLETYEAKVILTVRDNVDAWYESVMDTIWKFVELRISSDVWRGRKLWRGFLEEVVGIQCEGSCSNPWGLEEPEWDFPKVNDRWEFKRYQKDLKKQHSRVVFKNAMPYITAVVAAMAVGWYMYTRR